MVICPRSRHPWPLGTRSLICREATALSVLWTGQEESGVQGVLRKIVASIIFREWAAGQAVSHPTRTPVQPPGREGGETL